MSLNLCFKVKGGVGFVEFPYQTSTKLTKKVLNTKGDYERLLLIKKDLEDINFITEHKQTILEEVEALFKNNNLELTYI